MKILYDHQIFCTQAYGGISRYFCEIGSYLSREPGLDVAVLAPLSINEHLRADERLRLNGWQLRKFPYSGTALRLLNNALAPLYLNVRRGTDVYHETYYPPFDLAPRGAVRVVTVHDMIHEKFPDLFSWRDPTPRRKLAAVRRADLVICVSENTRRDLLAFHDIAESKVAVIPHGVTPTIGAGRVLVPAERKKQLIHVGARAGYKNFDALLAAFSTSHLRDEGFRIVCFGGGPFTSLERERINRLGLQSSIEFRTGCDAILSELLRESIAFVYPSLYEGFGIPLLEAMTCGCPIICSGTSSLPEVAGNAAEFFDPTDTHSIALALEQVALSEERRLELASAGAMRVQQYTWSRSAELTLQAYESVC